MKLVTKRVNRRAFLRGAMKGVGTVTVGLPFLEGLPERSAWAQNEAPVFGLFICTANGVVMQWNGEPERFWPPQTGALTKQNMSAAANERATCLLADYADKLLIIRGVRYPHPNNGCGHAQGLVQCLTASRPSGSNNTVTSTGPSADTIIAQSVNPAGVEPLTLYSGMKQGYIDEKLSFSAAGRVRAAEGNPYNVYQRLIGLAGSNGGSNGGNGGADLLALRRNSVNDVIREEMKELLGRSELSKADRERLDLHFQSIRDMERTMMEMGKACSADGLDTQAIQAMNSGSAFRQNGVIEQVAKLHMELVGFAFSCNANRVATLQIGDGTDQTRYTIGGQTIERFHWVSHRVQSDGSSGAAIPNAVNWHIEIDRIRMQTFKHLLDKWSQYTTPNGPLLDNAFALWTNQVSIGPAHSFDNLPMIIAGSGGGKLKQGQYIDVRGATNDRLLNTLIAVAGGKGTVGSGGQLNEMLA